VQSDIFDHFLAASKHFDLEIFQNISGNDLVLLTEHLSAKSPKTMNVQ